MAGDLHRRLLDHIDEYAISAAEDDYLVAPPLAALRTVVEIHAPVVRVADDGTACCPHCYDDATWPCATIRTIAEHLGVTP